MMEVVEEQVLDFVIELPKGKKHWTIHMLMFVDDKRHYSNKFQQNANAFLLKTMENRLTLDINSFMLQGRGEVETDKYA